MKLCTCILILGQLSYGFSLDRVSSQDIPEAALNNLEALSFLIPISKLIPIWVISPIGTIYMLALLFAKKQTNEIDEAEQARYLKTKNKEHDTSQYEVKGRNL